MTDVSQPDANPPAAGAPVVLVVEDDRTIRQLIRLTLEDDGIPVAAVADGQEAISFVERCRPLLVLLDMGLPLLGGDAVASYLHRRYGAPSLRSLPSRSSSSRRMAMRLRKRVA